MSKWGPGDERRGILYGLPVRLTEPDECEPIGPFTGLLIDFLVDTFGFNGWIMEYDVGSYWPALWQWLTTSPEDE